jgi:hypothetical protein
VKRADIPPRVFGNIAVLDGKSVGEPIAVPPIIFIKYLLQ